MKAIKIKICGMTDSDNIARVSLLRPDYMGFILYERSPRYVNLEKAGELVKIISPSIRRTGVLVNLPIEHALRIAETGIFDMLQLHGDESPDYCRRLSAKIPLIKAFRISKTLPRNLEDYQPFCTMFLFDTDGKNFGGSGKKFDHSILDRYTLNKGYLLSGGISAGDSPIIKSLYQSKIAGVDLNSRFELSPGIKNIGLLKKFIEKIRTDDDKNR